MIELIKKYKNIIIIVLVVVLGFFVYSFFFTGGPEESSLVASQSSTQQSNDLELGREIITLLNRLNDIKIDTGVFADPMFTSLRDFSSVIESQPIGRSNPFSPIGAGKGVAPDEKAFSIQTIPVGEGGGVSF